MQGDPGPSHSFDKKRKAVEGSSPVVNTSFREKRTRTSEAGEAKAAEPLWPDYFKEVSAFVKAVRLKLTLGTSLLSVVQGVFKRCS
jgi:hypothetical protein